MVIKLGNREIVSRKWKVKDRRTFIKMLSENSDMKGTKVAEALVYNCLEDPEVILSPEEFKYVLFQIRKDSVSESFEMNYTCEVCKLKNKVDLTIDEVIKFTPPTYKDIIVKDLSFSIGDVVNKKYYDQAINGCSTQEELYMVDFLYHISKFNSTENFTFNELSSFVENLDIDIMDEVLDQWDEQKGKLDDIHHLECSNCKNKEAYQFDEIPDFFPKKWFVRK